MAHLMDFYVCLTLPVFDPELASKACLGFCTMYGALKREAEREGNLAWALKPKFHLFQELAEFQSFEIGNPADFWNYKDEDFMGFVSALAFRRGGAVNPTTCTEQVLERYLLWLSNPALENA